MRQLGLAMSTPLLLTALAGAQTATFEMIPSALEANDISPDGRWIVGSTDTNGDGFPDGAYLLDRENDVLITLPAPGLDARAVSDDGSVVLGNIPDPKGIGSQVAAIWTAGDGWLSLGALPNALGCPSRSTGYELNADGTVAVGLSWDGCSGRGFVWTEATGMLELESLANGNNRASVVSGDGSVIAGFAQGSFSRTPATWNGETTVGLLLDPPNGDVVGEVHGVSDDGQTLLGEWNGDAFQWTVGQGLETFGTLLPGWIGIPTDIADDGTIVGFDILQLARQAWIRPVGEDIMSFATFLADRGVTDTPVFLEVPQAITPDGRFIIGHGFGSGAWIVDLVGECQGDISDNGVVDVNDLLAVIGAWGPCDGIGQVECDEDLNGDLMVDVNDLLIILGGWGPCP